MKQSSDKPLSAADRMLLQIGEGYVVRRERQPNGKIKHYIQKSAGRREDAPSKALTDLVTLGYVKAQPLDTLHDVYEFELTDGGSRRLRALWDRGGPKRER